MPTNERRCPRWVWPLAAAALAVLPVAGVFTTSRIFVVRDLTLHFWSHHLWLRNTWAAGEWPWWNPYFAGGHSGVADSLNHVFLLPMTVVRLLASDVVGFNIWVAASQPLAALGAYLLLRRDVSRSGALLGAALFGLCGPMVSTPNFPNLGYTAALMPWMAWAARRVAEQTGPAPIATLAAVFGVQALCGEPVILGTSAALAGMVVLTFDERPRSSRVLRVGSALAIGGLVAAVQLLPLAEAALHSARGLRPDTGGRLHPVDLVSTILAQPFGHFYHTLEPDWWLDALNGQLGPFLYSLYFGMAAMLWAVASAGHPAQRVRRFWTVTALVTVILSFGDNTVIYPLLREYTPLRSFRFPIKFLLVTSLAICVLAGMGWDAVRERLAASGARRHAATLAALAASLVTVALALVPILAPEASYEHLLRLAIRVGAYRPVYATEMLLARVPPLLLVCGAIAAGWALLVFVALRRPQAAPLALAALYTMTLADPATVNADLNPTMPVSLFREPEWVKVMRSHGDGRVYFGGRWGKPAAPGRFGEPLIDGAERLMLPAQYDAMEARALANHESMIASSGWKIREAISYDMPLLIPREYVLVLRAFVREARPERMRFLERAGIRYCVLPDPPVDGAEPLATLKYFETMILYECFPNARRVYVADRARVVPRIPDQVELLFASEYDPATVLIEREPGPAAATAAAAARSGTSSARIVSETNVHVTIEAEVGRREGYVVLLDSYNESWRAFVDGAPAELLRANAIYRAVRLGPGAHKVEFKYVPRAIYAGMGVSSVGILMVLGLFGQAALERRRARRRVEMPVLEAGPVAQV